MSASKRLGLNCLIALTAAVTACSDDGTTSDPGTTMGPASNTFPVTTGVTTTTPDDTTATQPTSTSTTNSSNGMTGTGTTADTLTGPGPTTTLTGTGPDTVTATSTTEPSTDTAISATNGMTTEGTTTLMGTTDASSSSGVPQVCAPNEVECLDEQNYQTCSADGLMWEGPTPCGNKLVCSAGQCVSKCDLAEQALSSIGCQYYAIDSNNDPIEGYDSQPYAVAVSNVDPVLAADVQIQAYQNGAWQTIQMGNVMPKQLSQFTLPDKHINYTGINARGAYRIISDIPIIAYQFQPINGQTSFTSDASLLLPSAAYDQFYYVLGWGEPSYGNAQINIVASKDATAVTITPTTATVAGGGLPALPANQPYNLPAMNEGDVIQIEANNLFAGTYITSDKPIAVFSTHWCANVPVQTCCCDHLEEQLYGLQKWGQTYVASRWPVRNSGTPEKSHWQIIAAEDNTTVNFIKHAEVTGIPQPQIVMNKGQVVTYGVSGSIANPGDFVVDADKPVFVMQYLSSSQETNAPADKAGDPAMAQAIPSEQYRSDYVVLVPTAWIYDFFTITKKTGTTVNLDGAPIAQNLFVKVGPGNMPSEWEVARIAVQDGVHALDGDAPFGVIVLGYDSYDSYAYPGGLDQKQINPQ